MAKVLPIGKNTRLGFFKKEVTEGTFVSPTESIHFLTEGLKYVPKMSEDTSNVGEVFTTDQIKVGYDVAGSVQANLHPYLAGKVFYYTLGESDAPTNPFNAGIFIWYTGTALYSRIRVVGTDMLAETSADGVAWVADTSFNTTGTIDLTSATFDTCGELSTAINGYTGWEAFNVGLSTSASSNIAAFSNVNLKVAGSSTGAYFVPYTVVSTTAKKHYIYSSNSSTSDIPSFSAIVDRNGIAGKSTGYSGIKINSLSMPLSPREIIQVDMSVRAKEELLDQTYSANPIPESITFTTDNCKVFIDRMPCEFKDLSLEINSGFFMDECVGSETFKTQGRQNGEINISGSLNYSISSNGAERATDEIQTKMKNNETVEIVMYFEGKAFADSTSSTKYSMIVKIPRIKLSDASVNVTGPERITLPITGKAVKDPNNKHIEVYVVNNDTTEY